MPYGITQCYLPPGRGDIPALTPAEAGTRLSDPGGMQGCDGRSADATVWTELYRILTASVCQAIIQKDSGHDQYKTALRAMHDMPDGST